VSRELLLLALVGGLAVLGWRRTRATRLRVTPGTIRATLPWFAVLGALRGVERALGPKLGLTGPTTGLVVYLGVALGVGVLWAATSNATPRRRARYTVAGAIVVLLVLALVGGASLTPDPRTVAWEVGAVAGAVALTVSIRRATASLVAIDTTGPTGVLFGHVLDVTTTAVGLGVLGATERNPVSRSIVETGDRLVAPGAGLVAFLLVKVGVALAFVALVNGGPDRDSVRGAAALTVAAGVGIVPAAHNLVVFATLTP
jgi:uncharacterized membrane protein